MTLTDAYGWEAVLIVLRWRSRSRGEDETDGKDDVGFECAVGGCGCGIIERIRRGRNDELGYRFGRSCAERESDDAAWDSAPIWIAR